MMSGSYHTIQVSNQLFEVEKKYELIKPIGNGAYGVVISALNKETGAKVAIKKVPRAFNDAIDAKRILREIKLLKKFKHENVIQIVDLIPPRPGSIEFEDIYIVQDLMETDLDRVINSRQGLSIDHVRFFIYQLLRGLKYLHSANVLHRDLKPSNILVNSNCDLKICDFGLARVVEEELSGDLTEYVVTRWYRAPEILLATTDYTSAIDVWSVGCIFAELLAREPVFPGQDTVSQLKLYFERLGKPDASELDFIPSEKTRRYVLSTRNYPPMSMEELFPKYRGETDALDLLAKMLIFHPNKRITVNDALAHPFMSTLHNPETESLADFTYSFPFDNEELSSEQVQELIWQEVREMHPEIPERCKVTSAAVESKIDTGERSSYDDEKVYGKRTRSPEGSYKR